MPDLRDHISHEASLYGVQGFIDTTALKTSVCCVPVLRDKISSITSLYRVPGLREKIALNRQCVVCQVYVTVFPL